MTAITAFLVLIVVGAAWVATPVNVPQERAQIEQTIRDYFQGGNEGDHWAFRRAFHPEAEVKFVDGGRYRSWSLDEYIARFPAGQKVQRRTRILRIDFTGTSATAKVEARYDTFRFIDYLSLLKIDGKWKIVAKIFYREEIGDADRKSCGAGPASSGSTSPVPVPPAGLRRQ